MDHGGKALIGLVAAHGNAFEVLEFAEEVLDEVPPLVDLAVDCEGMASPWVLGDDDFCSPLIDIFDDPVGIKSLVSDQSTKLDVVDQRSDADRVEAMTGQQDEAHEIAERVCHRENFGGHAAFRLADGLILSPPLAPWR